MVGHSEVSRWRYTFNCRKCANIQRVDDDSKHRHGNYCIPMIEAYDKNGPGVNHYDFDDDTRTISCKDYAPNGVQTSLFQDEM
jgi:hypothetical protein